MGRTAEAAAAYARAWELDPRNAVKAYLAISTRPAPADDVSEPLQRRALIEAHRRGMSLTGDRDSTPPIVQLTLIVDGASSRPIFAPALYAEGFRLIKAGRYPEAVARLRNAAANDPLVVDRASRSGPMSAGIKLLRDGRIREAIPLLESAATAHPDSSEVQRILGTVYGAAGDDDLAIAHLRSALRLAPADERTRLALGKRLRDAGRLSEAEVALQDAALTLPESGEVRSLLADVLARAGRGLEAARALEEAASLTTLAGKSALYLQAAEIYDRHQDFERAVGLLRERVRLDPNRAAAHKALGFAQTRIGRQQEALLELVMADLLGGGDAAVLAAIGQNHRAANRFADAEAALRRAVTVNPDLAQARYSLGQALLRLGRTEDAREQFDAFQRLRDRAMEEQRRTFELDKLRAEAVRHTSSGHHDMAVAALEKLVDRMPEQAEFRLALADALTRSGHVEDAVQHLERAAALGSGPDVYRRLAEVYARLGRREASERASQTYEQRLREFLRAPGTPDLTR
jgi:Flp pilus assembly protein TadD